MIWRPSFSRVLKIMRGTLKLLVAMLYVCSYVGELILASYRYVVVVLELLSALLVPELAMVHGVHWVARALSTIGYVPG